MSVREVDSSREKVVVPENLVSQDEARISQAALPQLQMIQTAKSNPAILKQREANILPSTFFEKIKAENLEERVRLMKTYIKAQLLNRQIGRVEEVLCLGKDQLPEGMDEIVSEMVDVLRSSRKILCSSMQLDKIFALLVELRVVKFETMIKIISSMRGPLAGNDLSIFRPAFFKFLSYVFKEKNADDVNRLLREFQSLPQERLKLIDLGQLPKHAIIEMASAPDAATKFAIFREYAPYLPPFLLKRMMLVAASLGNMEAYYELGQFYNNPSISESDRKIINCLLTTSLFHQGQIESGSLMSQEHQIESCFLEWIVLNPSKEEFLRKWGRHLTQATIEEIMTFATPECNLTNKLIWKFSTLSSQWNPDALEQLKPVFAHFSGQHLSFVGLVSTCFARAVDAKNTPFLAQMLSKSSMLIVGSFWSFVAEDHLRRAFSLFIDERNIELLRHSQAWRGLNPTFLQRIYQQTQEKDPAIAPIVLNCIKEAEEFAHFQACTSTNW